MFADAERLLVTWLQGKFPAARVVTELPADVTGTDIIQAVRIGGLEGDYIDQPRMDVDCISGTRLAARLLARQVQKAVLYDLPGYSNDEGTVLAAGVAAGIAVRWGSNSNVRNFGATYDLRIGSLIRFQ